MAELSPQQRPRMDMVRSMLADRDSRSDAARASRSKPKTTADDRRKLWQERLSQYVREPGRD